MFIFSFLLQYRIQNWTRQAEKVDAYIRTENLCNSLNYNAVPLLTITGIDTKDNRIPVSFLSGDV